MTRQARLLVIALPLLFAGCVGPRGSHRDGYEAPTEPLPTPATNVRGFVRTSTIPRVGIEGATVMIEGVATTTWADGSFTLGPFYVRAGTITVTKPGFVAVSRAVGLNPGEISVEVLMTVAPAAGH